ncbi:MAG: ATPase, T2SS/T4P/T4SS family [Candidatus Omnitrophota bacterium]|jgi:type IV pilus assembly protein PilB
MSQPLKTKIIQTLIETLKIKKEDLDEAIELQRSKNISLDRALIEKGLIKEEDLMVLLVRELHIPFINLKKYKIDPSLKEAIPERVARQYRILPISQMQKTVTIAMADPLNIFAIDDLKNLTGKEVDVVMSTESDILHAIEAYYGSKISSSVQDVSKDIDMGELEIISDSELVTDSETMADEGEQAPIIRLVNLVIREAIKQRASDIHIEPMIECMRVRYRIDGTLIHAMKIPKENQNAIIVRVKIMSRLDITASQVPQDGRFKMRVNNQEVDFRVSLLPTTFGQKIVLRVLDKRNLRIGLDGLGFSDESAGKLKEAIAQPFGMILVTGPTGSGKSTTLYSIVNELNTTDKNIITIEDPVEYVVDGLTQIQVKPDIGLTFAEGLKAILRQSPDIVMVGEIRDYETADIAIKASLTGQMVYSTLHTNDAAGALTRLVDMGVEPFLVASSLVMVCAQRLCRKICPHCKEVIDIPDKVLKELDIPLKKDRVFYMGKGCAHCRQSGFFGRLGITEMMPLNDHIREMLILGKSSDEIKEYARDKLGMLTLWDDGLQKFLKGDTTLDEVLRITSND